MEKTIKNKLFNLFYHYGVRNFPICGISVSTMVHEYGHLICSKLLLFGGKISSERPNAVFPVIMPLGNQLPLFYLSGGLLQFIVFLLMSLRGEDSSVKIANRMTAVIGLVEGLTEPIKYFRLSGLGAALGIVLSFLYLAYELIRETEQVTLLS